MRFSAASSTSPGRAGARLLRSIRRGAWALATTFIVVYEEPTLRRLFGEEYIDYCRDVRRWIPRLSRRR